MKRIFALLIILSLFALPCHAAVTGSVSLTNIRLSLVNGTAFVDFSAAGTLTPYLNYRLTLTDSAGKKAIGYIKAAGTGETLGDELVTNGGFADTSGWQAISGCTIAAIAGGQSGNCFEVTVTGAPTGFTATDPTSVTVTQNGLYLFSTYAKQPSGGSGRIYIGSSSGLAQYYTSGDISPGATWTQYSKYFVPTGTGVYVGLHNRTSDPLKTSLFDTVTLKQVLTPSVTGCTITSTPGGTTYNWTSIEAGFNYNDAGWYTYEISKGAVLTGGGAESSDRISFAPAPTLGKLITCDLTGYLRMRVRFKEDKFSRQSLTHLISAGGTIELKGLSPEDL